MKSKIKLMRFLAIQGQVKVCCLEHAAGRSYCHSGNKSSKVSMLGARHAADAKTARGAGGASISVYAKAIVLKDTLSSLYILSPIHQIYAEAIAPRLGF